MKQELLDDLQRLLKCPKPKTECANRALLDGALSGWHEEAIEFCHLAEVYDIGVTPLELTEELKRSEIFNEDGLPNQRFVDCGYFRVVEIKYVSSNAETNIIYKVIVYPLGIAFISGFTDALKDRKRQSND